MENKLLPSVLIVLAALLGGFVAYSSYTKEKASLSGTNPVPDVVALFETSLSSRISADATTFSLVSATDKDGNTLASSTYAFIIDEGTASEEFVIADCTGTSCTNAARGISVLTGTSTVTALKKAHGRGASVKITDGPILLIHNRLIRGIDAFPNLLRYVAATACDSSTAGTALCDIAYIRSIAGQGAATSTESLGGIVELATQLESASSTDLGADNPLVQQAKYATSSPGTAGLWDVWTNNAGKIAQAFLDWTQDIAFSGNNTHSGTETFTNDVSITGTFTLNGSTVTNPPFGGTGADGALALTSGTTTIDLARATTTVKNYSSISITGTGALAFSNPAQNGSLIVLKSQGACTFTSSAVPNVDASGMGAAGGAADANGSPGISSIRTIDNGDAATSQSGATGGASNGSFFWGEWYKNGYQLNLFTGGGGGGGDTASGAGAGAGGAGGRGGPALVIECGGAINFTSTGGISVAGKNGSNGVAGGSSSFAGGGAGGGGAGGSVYVIYATSTATSGTFTVSGGTGGTGGTGQSGCNTASGGAGGNGFSHGSLGNGGTGGSSNSGSNGGGGGGGGSDSGMNVGSTGTSGTCSTGTSGGGGGGGASGYYSIFQRTF